MNPTANKPTVILRHCEGYDVPTIRRLVREGMETLGVQPRGRTLAKPNLVAAGPLFEHALTRPEVMEAYLAWRAANAGRRLRGKPYQVARPTERGDGAPVISEAR